MHEAGIAGHLLAVTLDTAARHGLVTVEAVTVQIGLRRLVEPEALRQAFALAAEGTPAAGARLDIEEMPLAARCRPCGKRWQPRLDDWRCPVCGAAEAEPCGGDELIITAVSGDDAQGG